MRDFDLFKRRMLDEAWSSALGYCFIFVLFCAWLLFRSPSDCEIVPVLPTDDFVEMTEPLCEMAYASFLIAALWLSVSALRVLFLSSHWQTDPFLWMAGVRLQRHGGGYVTVQYALRYVIAECWAFHAWAIYVLFISTPSNIYTHFLLLYMMIAVVMAWSVFIVLVRRGRNGFVLLSGVDYVFTHKKAEKIARKFERRGQSAFLYTGIYADTIINFLVLCAFIGFVVHGLRIPFVDIDYQDRMYEVRAPVWEDNAYFALEGLFAPLDITDSYAYGRTAAALKYEALEARKKKAGLPHGDEVPADMKAVAVRWDGYVRIENKDKGRLDCLYDLLAQVRHECAEENDLKNYIAENRTIWTRFNAMPDYGTYSALPQGQGTFVRQLIFLAEMKAAQIVMMADEGVPDAAFNEWSRFMTLYRRMAGSVDTRPAKKGMRIIVLLHGRALQTLLYKHPDLAVRRYAEIMDALSIADDWQRAESEAADDFALVEPLMLWQSGNVNAVRRDAYKCLSVYEAVVRSSPLETLQEGYRPDCRLYDVAQRADKEIPAFAWAGVWFSNYMYMDSLLEDHLFYNWQAAAASKILDARLRMTALGAAILYEGVPAEDVQAFIERTRNQFPNPLTGQPFVWDGSTKVLYFDPHDELSRVYFPLPL